MLSRNNKYGCNSFVGASWAPPPTKANLPCLSLWERWPSASEVGEGLRGGTKARPYEGKLQNNWVIARPFRAVAIPEITGGFPRSRCSLGMTNGACQAGRRGRRPLRRETSLASPFGRGGRAPARSERVYAAGPRPAHTKGNSKTSVSLSIHICPRLCISFTKRGGCYVSQVYGFALQGSDLY